MASEVVQGQDSNAEHTAAREATDAEVATPAADEPLPESGGQAEEPGDTQVKNAGPEVPQPEAAASTQAEADLAEARKSAVTPPTTPPALISASARAPSGKNGQGGTKTAPGKKPVAAEQRRISPRTKDKEKAQQEAVKTTTKTPKKNQAADENAGINSGTPEKQAVRAASGNMKKGAQDKKKRAALEVKDQGEDVEEVSPTQDTDDDYLADPPVSTKQMTTKVVRLINSTFDVADTYMKFVRQHHPTNAAAPGRVKDAIEVGYEMCRGKRKREVVEEWEVVEVEAQVSEEEAPMLIPSKGAGRQKQKARGEKDGRCGDEE